jgi:hypothetical protein
MYILTSVFNKKSTLAGGKFRHYPLFKASLANVAWSDAVEVAALKVIRLDP